MQVRKQIGHEASNESYTLSIPSELAPFLEPVQLLPDENSEQWYQLVHEIARRVYPMDGLEWLDIAYVVDRFWDLLRLRRSKSSLLFSALPEGLESLLRKYDWFEDSSTIEDKYKLLTKDWAKGDPEAVKTVDEFLTTYGLTKHAIFAHAEIRHLSNVERMDRLIAAARAQVDGVLREIEPRRRAFAACLRSAVQDILDAEAPDPVTEPKPSPESDSPRIKRTGILSP